MRIANRPPRSNAWHILPCAALTLVPIVALARADSPPVPASADSNAAAQQAALVGAAADAVLKAISDTPNGSRVEAYEAAIMFSISQLGTAPARYVDDGLQLAAGKLVDSPARTAVLNVLRMKQRKTGTAGINGSNGNVLLSGPVLSAAGGGGISNYSN